MNPIKDDFNAVRSSMDISRSLFFYLSTCDPVNYPSANAPSIIRSLNDTLQGRNERSINGLLAELDAVCLGWKYYDEDRDMLRGRIKDFLHQKALLSREYSKTSDRQYDYEMHDGRKMIEQQLYDRAAKDGFPAGFFRDSFFHRVTLYCLPDAQDCSGSIFDLCTFAVCRINGMVTFENCSFYSCEFHSCAINSVSFQNATLAHTHFHDSTLQNVSFQGARLTSCNTRDCRLEQASFLNSTLDGCFFGRVQARGIRGLHTATITQGGSSDEEVRNNRKAIFAALRPEGTEHQNTPHRARWTR